MGSTDARRVSTAYEIMFCIKLNLLPGSLNKIFIKKNHKYIILQISQNIIFQDTILDRI